MTNSFPGPPGLSCRGELPAADRAHGPGRHAIDEGYVEGAVLVEGAGHGKVHDVDRPDEGQQIVGEIEEFKLTVGVGGQ